MQRFRAEAVTRPYQPKVLYRYFVTGRGPFPFDMLRYDSAWPHTGEDAAKLYHDRDREARSVELMSYREPTVARWASFNWSVGTDRLY